MPVCRLDSSLKELCTAVLFDVYNNENNESRDDRKTLVKQIDEQNERLKKAREFMLTSKIDPEDYTIIKKETEVELNKLEARLSVFAANPVQVDIFLDKAMNVVTNISDMYQNADNEGKRAIIGSMYPEKLYFDGQQHRTARINEVFELTYLISNTLIGKKRRARSDKSVLPTWVHPPGLEPGTKRL